ncbi:lytic murein transglycosylase [Patescibacteria group bacterium]|nr:lytic murein transglycosylase [Patescibacteria group bacterium]MBU2158867.1 lytic murein transglycosylase [Patescibacteria group bacterium]MBU2220391.1 lytic murein transglycosylase [Patescibacteria group bacterium]
MRRLFILPLILGAVLLGPLVVGAQSTDLTAQERAALERQLAQLEKDMVKTQATIDTLSSQGQSLQRDIAILDGEIKKAKLQVQTTEVEIRALSAGIVVHGRTINSLSDKLVREKDSLAQIIRKTDAIDEYTLVEAVLSTQDLSDFFADLDSFASIKAAMRESFEELRDTRQQTEKEKTGLEGARTNQQILKSALLLNQQKVQAKEAEKKKLLAETKGQESQYRQLKSAQEQTAAQIRAKLFPLRDTSGIQFGQAVDYAKTASKITGVRAALILAILSQESDLGKNVGQCLITSLETGDGKGKNTGTPFPGTMKAPRDTVPFARLMKAAGRDWANTPISCPLPGGYGGAMGPTQFIPSTWEMFEGKIKSALGVAAADPWNALHAITATGLYLADVGAAGGSYIAEHTAAARYYAGGNWATSGQGYGNSVMSKAAAFQKDIDFLNAN